MNRKTKIDKSLYAVQDRTYRQYMPEETSRIRENIEWSVTYSYNAADSRNPRVLLIGDSICYAYQNDVRAFLSEKMNMTFWATSKCVTDPDYCRNLALILNAAKYDVISFNNGLHSLTTDRTEWEQAYRSILKFIRKAMPGAKIVITLCTPLRPSEKTAISRELNETAKKIAADEKLPVIDLFTPMDKLDRSQYWSDDYHFQPSACKDQAKIIADNVLALLPSEKTSKKLVQKGSETGPSGKLK